MSRPVVWYVPGTEAASRLQELPDDLERCPVSELTLPTGPHLPGVLLVELPGDEASARALAVAQRDGLPVVALVAAETMTGINGVRVYALPHERLRAALRKYNRLVEPRR